jgi:hypothetical protein
MRSYELWQLTLAYHKTAAHASDELYGGIKGETASCSLNLSLSLDLTPFIL